MWFAFISLLQGRSPGDPILPPHFRVHCGCSRDVASRLGKVLWTWQGKREAGARARSIVLIEREISGSLVNLSRRAGMTRDVITSRNETSRVMEPHLVRTEESFETTRSKCLWSEV